MRDRLLKVAVRVRVADAFSPPFRGFFRFACTLRCRIHQMPTIKRQQDRMTATTPAPAATCHFRTHSVGVLMMHATGDRGGSGACGGAGGGAGCSTLIAGALVEEMTGVVAAMV